MSFQWLQLRIQEERDRQQREALTLGRLPQALEELHAILRDGLSAYTEAFGADSAEMILILSQIRITTREQQDGRWNASGKVEISIAPEIPGFRIERGEYSSAVEVGLLPSNKLYYRDREQDVYLTMEDLTKRILDRVLFPKLKD
jgi:hypothetical protein